MCGIAGLLKLDGSVADRDQALRMISTLGHRGPDASGVHAEGPIALGHSRLSIIDLSGGSQPMATYDQRLWITFNGEIFNYPELREELESKGHRFLTRSDTEVILNAYREWGDECVHRFNGQWAFALWDNCDQRLFLSRDRMGVRPLFYCCKAGRFCFASEIKALLASREVSPEIDLHALDQILTFWTTLAPRTIFKHVLQLPPASSLVIENGDIRVWKYWSPSFAQAEGAGAADESRLAEDLLNLLLDATRIRLRSDVPVGAYLSGGIDSTVTTALAKSIVHDRLRSFSISFEDAEFDESRYQDEASAFLSTQHTNVLCMSADIARAFPAVIRHTEQPIIRTAPAPMFLLSKLVHDSGFKVVLTGEGADEVLGGYDIFKEAKIRQFWGRQPDSRWRFLLLKRLYPYMDNIQRQPAAYLKHFFRVTPEDLASPFFSHLPRWDLTARLKLLMSKEAREVTASVNWIEALEKDLPGEFWSWSYFGRAEYLETQYLLPGYILSSQGDRMAMAHSVEGRYPFLDYRVVQFASRLPSNVKMKVLDQKHLLKLACRGLIPDSILRRPKQPYRAPDGKCFFGSGQPEYVDELLSPEAIRQNGIFDPGAVSLLASKFRSGRAIGIKDNMAIVAVLSTQLLIHQFVNNSTETMTHACLQR